MTKGTPSMGKRGKKIVHIRCRRCGNVSFHKRKGYCASCGFGKSKKFRSYNWINKTKSRN